MARVVARVLIIAVAVAAWSRYAAVWVPVYGVSVIHSVIVLRRHIRVRFAWSLLPLLPLVAPGATGWFMSHRFDQAKHLAEREDHAGAIEIYQKLLTLPTRSGMHGVHMRMGMSYEQLGDLSLAERELRRGVELAPRPGWPDLVLAGLYARHEGTSFFKPDLAMRMYADLIEADNTPDWVVTNARRKLRALRERYGTEP